MLKRSWRANCNWHLLRGKNPGRIWQPKTEFPAGIFGLFLRLAPVLGLLAVPLRAQAGATSAAGSRSEEERTSQTAPAGPEYLVQEGDTLYDIALRFGTTVAALQEANGIADPAGLSVGQNLIIPGYDGITGILATHTLEPGETIDSLSLRIGVSQATLVKLNRLLNPERIYVGLSMIVPQKGEDLPAVPTGRVLAGEAGGTLLGLAAVTGKPPWELQVVNRSAPYWLPGALLTIPGGDRPLTALPEPILDIQIDPTPPVQGKTVSIAVQLAAPVEITGTLGEWTLHFNRQGDWQYALQGLHSLAEPNLYPLRLKVRPESAPAFQIGLTLPMRDGAYGYDAPLVVDPSVNDPAVISAEFETVKAITSQITPVRLWDRLFSPPSSGHVVSFFGSRRSYNGGPYDSYHAGIDYYGGIGAPVLAPAPGVVVFAGPLVVRGNTTILDHGWGVFSGYLHQSEIQVTVGQKVETGDLIGLVGGTGRVTGPHLHWELWVGGVLVDPVEWTEVVFP